MERPIDAYPPDGVYDREDLDEIDLRDYLYILRERVWWVLGAMVLLGVGAFIYSEVQVPVYAASSTVLIDQTPLMGDVGSIALFNERKMNTYCQFMTTRPFLTAVNQRLEVERGISSDVVADDLKIEQLRNTEMLRIQVENENPVLAADIANMIVVVFIERIQALQNQRYQDSKTMLLQQIDQQDSLIVAQEAELKALGKDPENQRERERLQGILTQHRESYSGLTQSYERVRLAEAQTVTNLVQVEPALPNYRPVRPKPIRNVLLGVVVGAFLGGFLAFLLDHLDDTVKGPDEILQQLGLPVLGIIASFTDSENLIAKNQPRAPATEAFRSLRTNVEFASVDHPLQTLMVTSPSPGDGKTTMVANLGIVMAHAGRRVALIDCDFRKPMVHRIMNISMQEGLSSVLVKPNIHLSEALQESGVPGLLVMGAGTRPPNPAELLGSKKLSSVLEQLQEQFDLIILDSPPVGAVTDPVVLAPTVDGVLLVVQPRETGMTACRYAVEQLRRSNANLLGVVLNHVGLKGSRYYYRRNYYYYSDATYYDFEGDAKQETG